MPVNSIANPYAGTVNPFPSPLNPPASAYFPQFSSSICIVNDMRNPYMQSWNLTIERRCRARLRASRVLRRDRKARAW